jgi:4-hydroxybenzoate polyprenyltransferase
MPPTLQKPIPSRARVWLQLLRAPNLFTVPGDPVAGYLVSNDGFTDGSIFLVAAACLCFYAAGLLLNDLVDLAEDRLDRPLRPLPAGQANPKTVRLVLWSLNALGLALLGLSGSTRALACGAATVTAVWLYNCVTKQRPVWGALTMGACRGLSMLTGALAGPSPHAVPIAGLIAVSVTLYIAAVTHLARFETRSTVPKTARLFPVLALGPGVFIGFQNALYSPDKVPAALLFALTLGAGGLLCRRLFAQPFPLPPLIGAHIRLLLPLQAATCWFGASQSIGPACATGLLCLWPVSRLVSKRFYAS